MSNETNQLKKPILDPGAIKQVANGVWLIPDSNHTPLVPNVGIIIGERASLIIDTGFGAENARAVLSAVKGLGGDKPIYLTHTHCHPEHGFGANVISKEVTVLYNKTQWTELAEKGDVLLQMFKNQIPPLAPMLDGVEFIKPDFLYSGSMEINMGRDLTVELREFGGAHSRGDQVVFVRSSGSVLFTGDLVEEGYFGILGDDESHVLPWINRLHGLEQLNAEIVVPGHGLAGDAGLLRNYRAFLELARQRVNELRQTGSAESEIVDKVSSELLARYPDWKNRDWARKTVEDLSWRARK